MQKELEEAISRTQKIVFEKLNELVPEDSEILTQAIRYSLLCSGKRLRPLLVIESAKIFGDLDINDLITIACAVEMVHIFSLIHDDLPCMDNDDYRRNELTCHKKFNEYDALLAGDSLLSLAFETIISKTTHITDEEKCRIVLALSKAVGYKGMCLGQSLDMRFEKENKAKTFAEAERINTYKTGYLFKACVEIGCILGKADFDDMERLIDYSINFGKAFQLKDDLEDKEIQEEYKDQTKILIEDLVKECFDNLDSIKFVWKNRESIDILKMIAKFCLI